MRHHASPVFYYYIFNALHPGQQSDSKMDEKPLLCGMCSEVATALNSSYSQMFFFFDSFLINFFMKVLKDYPYCLILWYFIHKVLKIWGSLFQRVTLSRKGCFHVCEITHAKVPTGAEGDC